jgi:ribonucleoside-diphosphate reductase alpha chain
VSVEDIADAYLQAWHLGIKALAIYRDGSKTAQALRGMMNAFATSISIALQYGVPLETLVRKVSYMRFDPEGITNNPEIPFAKSMPDYIMRWLASRFLDTDTQEDLGILTPEVRARKMAEDTALAGRSDTAGPENGGNGQTKPAAAAMTDTPPVQPAKLSGSMELGPACSQCGGMMQRTGSCYTCSSCGNNTGCG